ncbi:hypothetical protein [Candidatus Poriferisocius sp.]
MVTNAPGRHFRKGLTLVHQMGSAVKGAVGKQLRYRVLAAA